METIKEWAISLSATCVIASLVELVTPSGRFEKSVKILTALLLIICFVSPIFKLDLNALKFEQISGVEGWINDEQMENEMESEVINVLKKEIRNRLTTYFSQNNIHYLDVSSDITIDENKNISISSITIVLCEDRNRRLIEEFVYSDFGIIPQIVIDSGVMNEY